MVIKGSTVKSHDLINKIHLSRKIWPANHIILEQYVKYHTSPTHSTNSKVPRLNTKMLSCAFNQALYVMRQKTRHPLMRLYRISPKGHWPCPRQLINHQTSHRKKFMHFKNFRGPFVISPHSRLHCWVCWVTGKESSACCDKRAGILRTRTYIHCTCCKCWAKSNHAGCWLQAVRQMTSPSPPESPGCCDDFEMIECTVWLL